MGAARNGADDLGAGAQPDIVAVRMAHAEHLVDLAGVAAGNRACHPVDTAIIRMHQPCGISKG
ncbi:hypothetical protein D3C87_1621660 [compost metagenome]